MEWIDTVAGFLANPWFGGALSLAFIALGAVTLGKIKNLGAIKAAVKEFLDVAKIWVKVRDPKSPGGKDVTDDERVLIETEMAEAIAALAAVWGRDVSNT